MHRQFNQPQGSSGYRMLLRVAYLPCFFLAQCHLFGQINTNFSSTSKVSFTTSVFRQIVHMIDLLQTVCSKTTGTKLCVETKFLKKTLRAVPVFLPQNSSVKAVIVYI